MSVKFGLTAAEAVQAIGSRVLLRQMEAANWIRPVMRRKKLCLYDHADLIKAWARIRAGEVPQPKAVA